ncbi:uncharacterized protein P884DRAFT_133402 [Thermothelomyces heterothallicus CBS 202.75]|uniref:uncharacterized protein n=1 Tax=Thermothelomyces heterothallicus CBS 202.75 TaxID=1149848 RepID=UPI0037431D97
MARDCTEERNLALVQCRNCDEFGHMSKDCPKPRDSEFSLTRLSRERLLTLLQCRVSSATTVSRWVTTSLDARIPLSPTRRAMAMMLALPRTTLSTMPTLALAMAGMPLTIGEEGYEAGYPVQGGSSIFRSRERQRSHTLADLWPFSTSLVS